MQEEYTEDQIRSYCFLIDELVKKSEWIIEKSLQTNSDHSFEIAALLSIRQMADYADGVSILILHHSNDSTIPVIRSMFEVSVGLEYLLQDDFEGRAKKFLFFYYKQKEIELLKIKKGSNENKIFIEELKSDPNVSGQTIEDMHSEPDIEEKLSAVQQLLEGEMYFELQTYFSNSKTSKKKYWYSLLDGPPSFKKLTESLSIHSRYLISYKLWSGYSHGWDIVNRNLIFEDGELAKIIFKRNPTGSYINALETIMILRRSLMKYAQVKLKHEILEFGKWVIDYNKRLEALFKFNSH